MLPQIPYSKAVTISLNFYCNRTKLYTEALSKYINRNIIFTGYSEAGKSLQSLQMLSWSWWNTVFFISTSVLATRQNTTAKKTYERKCLIGSLLTVSEDVLMTTTVGNMAACRHGTGAGSYSIQAKTQS